MTVGTYNMVGPGSSGAWLTPISGLCLGIPKQLPAFWGNGATAPRGEHLPLPAFALLASFI